MAQPARHNRRLVRNIRRVASVVALFLAIGFAVGAYSNSTTSASPIAGSRSELRAIFFSQYKSSGFTSTHTTVGVVFAGSGNRWALLTVKEKNPNPSQEVFGDYAHFTNGKWHLLKGIGPIWVRCPEVMTAATCTQFTRDEIATLPKIFRSDVKETKMTVTNGLAAIAPVTVSSIQWNPYGASFTVTETGKPPPVKYTFNFGTKKDYVATQAHEILVAAVADGNSVPFIEAAPYLIVSACIPNTKPNMGKNLEALETPFVQKVNAFVSGVIYVANSNGLLDSVVSSQEILECNGSVAST